MIRALNRRRMPTVGEVARNLASIALTLASLLPSIARAANQWDISPYDVRVWITTDNSPEMNAWTTRLPNLVKDELELRCGAAWNVTARIIDRARVDDLTKISFDSVSAIAQDAEKADKIFVVKLNGLADVNTVAVREFDCNTRRASSVWKTDVEQDSRLLSVLTDSILRTFAPIGMIGRSQDDFVVVRMRAGLLDVAKQTPITPANGSLLHIVLRRSDRLGNPLPNGIKSVAWTVLVTGPTPENKAPSNTDLIVPPGAVHCQIVSGLRNPIRSRGSRRMERFALESKPFFESTTLRLVKREDQTTPLAGYDVYQRLPKEKKTTRVGRSDWQGELTIPRNKHPLKTFYIKNGDRLLARLPIVVGSQPLITAQLTDDSLRLEAEGFLKGIQEEVIDLIARREIFSLRIQKRIENSKLDDAEALLDELRLLPTRQDIERRIREREANFQTRDKAQQDRINRLFRDTRRLVLKHLSSSGVEELRNQLSSAQQSIQSKMNSENE